MLSTLFERFFCNETTGSEGETEGGEVF